MNSGQKRDSNLVLIHLLELSLKISSLLNTVLVQYVKISFPVTQFRLLSY